MSQCTHGGQRITFVDLILSFILYVGYGNQTWVAQLVPLSAEPSYQPLCDLSSESYRHSASYTPCLLRIKLYTAYETSCTPCPEVPYLPLSRAMPSRFDRRVPWLGLVLDIKSQRTYQKLHPQVLGALRKP